MNAQPQPFRRNKLVAKVRTGPAGHPRTAKLVKNGPKILQSFTQPDTHNTSRVLGLATKAMEALEALKNESKEEEALRDAFAAVKALRDRAIARMQ